VSLEQRTHRTVMFHSHFSYPALRAQRLRTPLIAPLLATWLRGTGPLRSLRKACALLFASLSTAESGINNCCLNVSPAADYLKPIFWKKPDFSKEFTKELSKNSFGSAFLALGNSFSSR
jgi:hypothetical protein